VPLAIHLAQMQKPLRRAVEALQRDEKSPLVALLVVKDVGRQQLVVACDHVLDA
jgi:hypothetical protein